MDRHADGTMAYEQFVEQAVAAYAEGVAGRSTAGLAALGRTFASARRDAIFPYVHKLIRQLRAAGVKPIIVTGSPLEAIVANAKSWASSVPTQ